MTIDEEISHVKEVAAIQRSNEKLNRTLGSASPYINETCLKCAEEHEQLAEWLEDYKRIKMLIPIEQALKAEYNKALDDFVKFASDMPTVEEEDGEIRPMWLEEIAEKLKAGASNGNL